MDDLFGAKKKSPSPREEGIDMNATMRQGLQGTWQPPSFQKKKTDMDPGEKNATLPSPKSR